MVPAVVPTRFSAQQRLHVLMGHAVGLLSFSGAEVDHVLVPLDGIADAVVPAGQYAAVPKIRHREEADFLGTARKV